MIYVFDGFELDTELFELRSEGEVCHVEPQVFNLLRYLIENADHVVSKDELLEKLWPGRVVSESALTSRLKTARRIIGDSGSAQRLIRTIHGRGYRFVGEVRQRGAGPGGAARHAIPAGTPERRGVPDSAGPPAGREAEFELLQSCWSNARGGRLEIAFVEGEAGIGKTTLVEAFVDTVGSESDVLIATGQCADLGAAGEAYLPVLDALGSLIAAPEAQNVRGTLQSVAPSWLLQLPAPLSPDERMQIERRIVGVTQQRMLREFVAAARELSSEQPLLLVLEDLHWSDPSTLALLAWLGRRREPLRLMILGSLRPPSAGNSASSLPEIVDSLCLRRLATRLSLGPLDRAAVRAILQRRFAGLDIDDHVVDALAERTEGNPLFLASVVENLVDRGALTCSQTGVALNEQSARSMAMIPDSLKRMIADEIDRAGSAARRLLDAASVVETRFAASLVAAMLDDECEQCESQLAELAASSALIQRDGDVSWPDGTASSQFRFRHSLFRETLYAALPAAQRTRLHGLAAERLEAAFGVRAGERSVELAAHYTAAGNVRRALRFRLQAAQQAYGRGGYGEVIAHLDEGLKLLRAYPDIADHDELELSYNLAIGPALIQLNGWSDPRAEQSVMRAIELARKTGDRRLASAIYLLAAVRELRGEYDETQRLLEEQQKLPEAFDSELAELESHELLACSLYHQGNFAAALEHAEAGLAVGRDYDLDSKLYAYGENPRVSCHNWAGLSQWFLGFGEQASARIAGGLELARRPDRRFSLSNALCQAATLSQLRGEPDAARTFATEAIAVAEEEGFRYPHAVARVIAGWAVAINGDSERGIAEIRKGLEEHLESGAAMDRGYFLGLLAEALIAAGHYAQADEVLNEALAGIDSSRRFFHEPELLRLKARVAVSGAEPDAARARELLRQSRAVALASGNRIGLLRAETDLVRIATAPRDRESAMATLRRTLESFVEDLDSVHLREASALMD